ncbi:MAG: hypothetical protein SCJ97_11575, partial [Bacillota bacterium]|nr:hypothetical protein [Bacillota bacterium]
MNKKILITVTLTLVLTLALALPAFSQGKFMVPFTTGDLSQTISYEFEGKIDFEKQVGHLCNTGAEMKQAISGDGKLSKASEIYMKAYFMDVMDSNSFVTAPDAVRNMEVITAIELCAPPKYVFIDDWGVFEAGDVYPAPLFFINPWMTDDLVAAEIIKPLTRQIWATSVSADPGHTGVYMGGF